MSVHCLLKLLAVIEGINKKNKSVEVIRNKCGVELKNAMSTCYIGNGDKLTGLKAHGHQLNTNCL